MRLQINTEISYFNYERFLCSRQGVSSERRADPRDQLIHAEWLSYVVVSSCIECFHLYPFLAFYGKHYQWNIRNQPQSATELQTSHVWHREIGYYQCRMPIAEEIEGALAIGSHAHVETMTGQSGAHDATDLRLI